MLALFLISVSPSARSQVAGAGVPTSGGGFSSSGVYSNHAALGQVASGPIQGGDYVVESGALVAVDAVDPRCPEPRLLIRPIAGNEAELVWISCAGNSYEIQWTRDFVTWQPLTSPLAAPPGGGPMTWTVPVSQASRFYRLAVE